MLGLPVAQLHGVDRVSERAAGVEVGQRVVTQGGLGLEDKAKVRIMKPGEKAAGEKDEADEEKN